MSTVLKPLEFVVAWVMVQWHSLLTTIGLPATSGWTWALSIVGLVVTIRIVLIPLFVKQIKASRGLQLVQPEIKKIQAKYKDKKDPESRQKMTQETMALYKESGTNPFASCLPILLQSPIFFALFRVLNGIRKPGFHIGPLTDQLREQADGAKLFGSPISATFLNSDLTSTKIVTIILIALMSATTFTTQRQLMMKNMPASALDNPFAQQQKVLLYVLPLVFAVSGVNFPIGVLLYWLTTNVWSMCQQFYVIRRMPAPGSPAEKALLERRAKRGRTPAIEGGDPAYGTPPARGKGSANGAGAGAVAGAGAGGVNDEPLNGGEVDGPIPGQRVQPKKQTKRKRTTGQGPKPAASPGSGPNSGSGPGAGSGPGSGASAPARGKLTENLE